MDQARLLYNLANTYGMCHRNRSAGNYHITERVEKGR